MPFLTFTSYSSDKIVPKIQDFIQGESNSNCELLDCQVKSSPDASQGRIQNAFRDIFSSMKGSTPPLLFSCIFRVTEPGYFNLTTPRKLNLQVDVHRQGIASMVRAFTFTIQIKGSIDSTTSLEEGQGILSSPKFVGDIGIAQILNSDTKLFKKINNFTRSKLEVPAQPVIEIDRHFRISPHSEGILVTAKTTGYPLIIGIKDFFEIAKSIEMKM